MAYFCSVTKFLSFVVLFAFVSAFRPVLAGEAIIYDGDGAMLQNAPGWVGVANALFPGTTASPGGADNQITVDYVVGGGNINPNHIFGGLSNAGSATSNSVTISGGTVNNHIYGGSSNTGSAASNSVTMNGGAVGGDIYGGRSSATGSAGSNSVTMNGGAVGGVIYGGRSGSGSAGSNSVTMSDGAVGAVYGGRSGATGSAASNNVTISGGNVGVIYGGSSVSGSAVANSVILSGGAFGSGGVYGGLSTSDSAASNSVTMSGGTVSGDIYGGRGSATGSATSNSVTMSGGSVNRNIYGGYSVSGSATGNIVTLYSGADLDPSNSRLYGGYVGGGGGDARTGNILNLYGWRGGLRSINNFETINFYLPVTVQNGDVMVTSANASAMDGVTIQLGFMGDGSLLAAGDSITLIDNISGVPDNLFVRGKKGGMLLYDFELFAGADLVARVASVQAAPQAKVLSESRLGGVAFLNQGADMAAGQGMMAALDSFGASGKNVGQFTAISGGTSRYNTGSHVNVDGFSFMTGLAWQGVESPLTIGVFLEAGRGNYDTYNSFANKAAIRGGGDTSYYGGGVLGRVDFLHGFYADASGRAGWSDTDFYSGDLADFTGQAANYDSGSAYFGAHAGLGYVWRAAEKTEIDLSTKYLWTRQNGDQVDVLGDPVHFQAVQSHRWQSGARVSYAALADFSPYAGAAFEYDFSGRANVFVYDRQIDAASLKGGSGIGELGFVYRPASDHDFSADLGVQGYVGTREGVTGRLQISWKF